MSPTYQFPSRPWFIAPMPRPDDGELMQTLLRVGSRVQGVAAFSERSSAEAYIVASRALGTKPIRINSPSEFRGILGELTKLGEANVAFNPEYGNADPEMRTIAEVIDAIEDE